MRLRVLSIAAVASMFALLVASSAHAETAAEASNIGLHTQLGPAILLGSDGSFGIGAEFALRYGIQTGPVILAPGGRVAGYYYSVNDGNQSTGHFIGDVMPTFRVTAPLGPFAPFVEGGVGPGIVTNDTAGGVALYAGVGLMIHFSEVFALGAEFADEAITNTGFHAISIGPVIQFGF
jgi:hypothetical protein